MPAKTKNEILDRSNTSSPSSSIFTKLAHGDKKKIKKNRESKKCPLCFDKKPCTHGKKITDKLGLKAAFIGSYNKKIQAINVPTTKRDSFRKFILDLMNKFEVSLPDIQVDSKEQKDKYRDRLVNEFYGKILEEANKRNFEQSRENLCISDDESVDLSGESTTSSSALDDDDFERDLPKPIPTIQKQENGAIEIIPEKKDCCTSPICFQKELSKSENKKTAISVGVDSLGERGYFIGIDRNDCEDFESFKFALRSVPVNLDNLLFQHPETKLFYQVNNEMTLQIIQNLLDSPNLLKFKV